MGKIYFIGAGPGDPELITIKGARLIGEADTVIYAGSLVSPEILRYAKKEAAVYNSALMNLEEVLHVETEALQKGKTVARIHTGDPSIYGAIREQMDGLVKAGIQKNQMEVVPGVSSFVAAAAALKAEYTLPGVSQTVILTRMKGRTPVPAGEELKKLAMHHATMCIFLSVQKMDEVVKELLEGGYDKNTPAAVVYRASWPDEKIVRGTLSTIAEKVKEEQISRQAMIVVGNVLGNNYELSRLYDKNFETMYRGIK